MFNKPNRITPWVLTLTTLMLLSGWSFMATAAENGRITGTIALVKDGQDIPLPQQWVRASIYRDGEEIAGTEAETAADGQFVMTQLDTGKAYSYVLFMVYEQVPYIFGPYQFAETEPAKEAGVLKVYPSTGSLADISMSTDISVVVGQQDILKVIQKVRFFNDGSQVYQPILPEAEPITVDVIPGAYDLQFLSGYRSRGVKIDQAAQQLIYLENLIPGRAEELSFSYFINVNDKNLDVTLASSTQQRALKVFLSDSKVKVASAQLNREKLGDNEVYSGGPLPAGEKWAFSLQNIPLKRDFARRFLWAGIALALITCGLLALYLRRSLDPDTLKNQERENAMAMLKKIEADQRAGVMSVEEYHILKKKLRDFLCLKYLS